MSYRLGIDMGTTFTAAAVLREGGQPNLLGLGNRAMQIPSVFYITSDGVVVVGEVAERRGASDPDRLVRESKRRIGDPTPLVISGMPFTAQTLAAKLLRWVLARATQQMGEPPGHVVVTHPANWGPFKLDLMREVVRLADLTSASLMTEPSAAAAQYAARERVKVGDTIAVYDLGGGTFDACVLTKNGDGFQVRGRPEGVEHLGGIDFDEAIFHHVLAGLGGADHLDLDAEEVVIGLARLRRDCVEAKEALSDEVDANVRVDVPGLRGSVRITRSEFEALVRPALLDTHTALRRALRSAGADAADLSALVLVGGASRMPIVKLLLEQELGLTASVDFHPKHDVVLGAVRPEAEPSWEDALPGGGSVAAGPVTPDPADAASRGVGPRARPSGAAPAPEPSSPASGVETDHSVPVVHRPGAKPPVPAPHAPEQSPPTPAPPPVPPPVPPPSDNRTEETPARDDEENGGPRVRLAAFMAVAVAVLVVVGLIGWMLLLDGDERPSGGSEATRPATPTPTDEVTGSTSLDLPRGDPLTDREMVVIRSVGDVHSLVVGDSQTGAVVQPLTRLDVPTSPTGLSPDRRTVAYVNEADGVRSIYAVGTNGGRQVQLLDEDQCGDPGRPAWSPAMDGTRLVLSCSHPSGDRVIVVIGVDGSDPVTVARGPDVGQPTVDSTGERIAYVDRVPAEDGGGIMIVGADGGGPSVEITDGDAFLDGGPVWSSDGTRLAIRHAPRGGNGDIAVLDVASREVTVVADDRGNQFAPSWSPDDTQIAFVSNSGGAAGGARIVAVPAEPGSLPTPLFPDVSGRQTFPLWSRH